jgi:hypothetical protein
MPTKTPVVDAPPGVPHRPLRVATGVVRMENVLRRVCAFCAVAAGRGSERGGLAEGPDQSLLGDIGNQRFLLKEPRGGQAKAAGCRR